MLLPICNGEKDTLMMCRMMSSQSVVIGISIINDCCRFYLCSPFYSLERYATEILNDMRQNMKRCMLVHLQAK